MVTTRQTRDINDPRPGFFLVKKVRGGPEVPARIHRPCCCTVNGGDDNESHEHQPTCDRFPPLRAEIDGEPAPVLRVWLFGRKEISEADYRYRRDVGTWARTHAPDDPAANPDQAVDMMTAKPLF